MVVRYSYATLFKAKGSLLGGRKVTHEKWKGTFVSIHATPLRVEKRNEL